MSNNVEQIQERRNASQQVIERMLKERNQLFSLLLQVSSDENQSIDPKDDLEELVQVLVDYIAAAHFSLYERISEGKERRKAISDLAITIYPRIEQTTEIALAFDEKYNPDNKDRDLKNLHADLSLLCEELTTRIELEDQLINSLLGGKTN
ncbi:MAG: Rsd/AlgQ family anti-sigma factor [Pseudomonadota bacterium]